jgi:hypothetical protein
MSDWRTYVENFYRQSPSEQHRLWSLLSAEQRAAFLATREAGAPAAEPPQAALRNTPPPRPGVATLSDDIDNLTRLGRELNSSSGIFTGLGAKRTNEFLAWRLRCITLLREMGPRAEHLLATVERRKPMYYQAFHAEILGALESARDIVSRQTPSPQSEIKKGNSGHSLPEPDAGGETRVFIVHGHDHSSLQQAARLMEQLELVPIILAEEVSRGRTIIEKLEERAESHAALVLLTPDDVGSTAADAPQALKPRARQNVILELGYFLGLLGRHRVVVLYTPGIELPSDFVGVEYIKLDSEGAWKLRVARELRAGNLPVNLNNMS